MPYTFKSRFAIEIKREEVGNIEGLRYVTCNIGLYNHKNDLLIIEFVEGTQVAGLFTKSLTASDVVEASRRSIKDGIGTARVLIVNSGCALVFVGQHGLKVINEAISTAQQLFQCKQTEVFLGATGVIGEYFDPSLIPNALLMHKSKMTYEQDYVSMVRAIETTDTFHKVISRYCSIDGVNVCINAIIKGSGMIEPNSTFYNSTINYKNDNNQ